MKLLCLALVVLFIPITSQGQQKKVSGRVVDAKSLEIIPFSHLYNFSLRTGTHADLNGNFELIIRVDDFIRISAIGFKTKFYMVDEDDLDRTLTLTLDEEVLELDHVEIFAYKDLQSFKQAIVEIEVEPEQKFEIYGLPKAGSDYGKLTVQSRVIAPTAEKLVATVGPTFLSIPIAVVDKERILVERKKAVAIKYSVGWIKEVTGLAEMDIDEFIRFCRLEEDFIFESTVYDLTVAVLTCLDNFKTDQQ